MTDNLDELITMLLDLEPRYCPKTGEHLYDVPANRDGRLAVAAIEALTTERDALAAELAKAREPGWFYHPDYTETCQFGVWDVVEYYDLEPGKHVVEVETARPLPSIWCAVHVLTDKEKDALGTDEAWLLTEHKTEEEARAALQQKDRNDEN